MLKVPFQAYISLLAPRPGTRWEYLRDFQKIAVFIYDALNTESSIQMPAPEGSQFLNGSGDNNGSFSTSYGGLGIKPRFGDFPDMLTVSGWYLVDRNNTPVATLDNTIFAQNQIWNLQYPNVHRTNIQSFIYTEVAALKSLLLSACQSAYPVDNSTYKMFQMDYSGLVFGYKGQGFPS